MIDLIKENSANKLIVGGAAIFLTKSKNHQSLIEGIRLSKPLFIDILRLEVRS